MKSRLVLTFVVAVFISGFGFADTFTQTNLVSDGSVVAAHTDPNLINPWGVAFSPTGPFWVADNGAGVSSLYNSSGTPQALVVTMPAGASSPTGVAFNNTGSGNFNGDVFIFATEEGTINGWRGALGTNAEVLVNSSAGGAVYTGLAIVGTNLYVADFGGNKIDVFDSNLTPTSLPGSFTDPTLPAGYAAFNIQNIGGLLYVTYGKASGAMLGDGFIDVFDANGNFVRRLTGGGSLFNPWGMAVAPIGFGSLGGDLLVGNFGNGRINAFDSTTGAFLETLSDASSNPIVNASLWGLTFGNGGNGGDPNTLYFTAGLENEQHGLLGSLTNESAPTTPPVPEPGSLLLITSGITGLFFRRFRR